MFLNGINEFVSLPHGLDELITDITREVLREQPMDLYRFIAAYLDALLNTRENIKIAHNLVRKLRAQLNDDDMQTLLTQLKIDFGERNLNTLTTSNMDTQLLFKTILNTLPRSGKLDGLSAAICTMKLYEKEL